MVLAQVLSQMKDKSGRIKIDGFYDDVVELRPEERAEWEKLPFNEKKYKAELGAPKLFGETGYTTLERMWARPTFEVNGLLSGFTGEGAKTVLPAVAMAKVSMRLVPNQDPKKIGDLFEEYVKKVTPKTVELKITRMHGGKPWMTAFDNPFVQAAGRAIEQGFGQRPVFNREGGSIPVVSTFQEELGVPCVLFGVGLPDENAHAPDEKLDLGNFHNGVIASAYLYREIGALKIYRSLDDRHVEARPPLRARRRRPHRRTEGDRVSLARRRALDRDLRRIVAAVFAGVGIWLGRKLTRTPKRWSARSHGAGTGRIRRDQGKLALGITPRELEILELIAQGLSNKEIAERVFVSENTVKTHSSRVFDKLGARANPGGAIGQGAPSDSVTRK